jgi:Ca-activated chloride channel family protein
MRFLEPMAWAFAASLVLVVLLHLLKRRRRNVPVPSLVLWERFLQDTRASHPFQRLHFSWLLLLQLLALAVLVAALARPVWVTSVPPAPLRVLILDVSASMQASDVAPSRFEQARAQALRLVADAAPGEELAVIRAGVQPQLVQTPTRDHASVRKVVSALEPTDAPGRLMPALRLAEALVRQQPDARIELFTDGAAADWDEGYASLLPLTEHRVGRQGENLAVVACEVRVDPEPPQTARLVARVKAFSGRALSALAELRFEGELLERRPLVLEAGQSTTLAFALPEARAGLWELSLETRDDLAVDNRVVLPVRAPRPVRVVLVSPGNLFLERALRALPWASCVVATQPPPDLAGVDVLVLDRVPLQGWGSVPVLAFGTWPWEPGTDTRSVESPTEIVDWDPTHPVLRHVQLEGVHAARLEIRPPLSGAEVLAECRWGPVLLAGQRDGCRFVWAGFSVLDSDWPLRVSFPIFMANAVDWLTWDSRSPDAVRAGEPVNLRLERPVSEVEVEGPEGQVWRWILGSLTDRPVFGPPERCGVYRFRSQAGVAAVCVNLLDEKESDLRARASVLKEPERVAGGSGTGLFVRREFWAGLAAIFLALLLAEWWWYHRRSV